MAVSRTDEINDISKSLEGVGIDFGDPFKDSSIESSNAILLGATLRTSTSFGKAATVAPGEDIRVAINALKSAGGGTLILLAGTHRPTYDIVGDSKINIVGEGIDQTIIDFEGRAYGIKYEGDDGTIYQPSTWTILNGCRIHGFTVKNSNASAGVRFYFVDNFEISSVKIESCDQVGLYISACQQGRIDDVILDGNTSYNFYMYGDDERTDSSSLFVCNKNITIENVRALNGGADGFYFYSYAASPPNSFIFIKNCVALDNTDDGFKFTAASSTISYNTLINCVAETNGGYGFTFDGVFNSDVIGSLAYLNTTGGFYFDNNSSLVLYSCSGDDYIFGTASTQKVMFVSCVGMGNDSLIDEAGGIIVGSEINIPRESVTLKNTSGGTLTRGTVVIQKSVAGGDEFTTTTTAGDDKVVGMLTQTLTNDSSSYVLTRGKTSGLKVDGTTDIAVGDFLCTSTTAGIAQKATTGDMAFAIALEQYQTDDQNGVIDALIISPRKI